MSRRPDPSDFMWAHACELMAQAERMHQQFFRLSNSARTQASWEPPVDVFEDEREVVIIIAMPGVPREMTPMWESVEPSLTRGGALRWRTLKLLGIGESAVEEKLAELVRSTSPTVATYAKNDGVHVRVADKARTPEEADRRVAEMEKTIRARLGEYVWGTNDETLPIVIGRRLAEHGWRLALAESLSAGDIARAFADAPGAERWFAGAVVRPTADAETLDAEGKRLGGDVLLVTPHGVETSELRAILPGRTRRLDIRFRSIADGRRRALLSGLDLLRRALAD